METKQMKLIMSLYLGGILCSPQLWADQVGSLGTLLGAGATDIYKVSCTSIPPQNATHQLYFTIQSNTINGAVMSAQALKTTSAGSYSKNTTDPISGDAIPSPVVLLKNGPDGDQDYYITINHTARFPAAYVLSYQCQDVNGVQTGTKIQIMQNQ